MSAVIRERDLVTVHGVVLSSPLDFDGVTKVKIRVEPYHEIFVLVSDVAVVRPDFRVGDMVTWPSADGAACFIGSVLSVAHDHLWVDLGEGAFATVWAGKAMRIDPEAEHDAELAEIEGLVPPAPLDGKVGSEEEAV